MNPSKPVEWVSFKEVNNLENQKILQKYLRYLFGITDLLSVPSESSCWELRTFLVHFNGEEKPIYEVESREDSRDICNPFRDRIPVKRQQMEESL